MKTKFLILWRKCFRQRRDKIQHEIEILKTTIFTYNNHEENSTEINN